MSVSTPRLLLPTTAAFVRTAASLLGWRLGASVALAVALGVVEGAGLLLLVPLLAGIGLTVNDGPTSGIAAFTLRAFATIGLTPTLPSVLLVFFGVSVVHALLYRSHLLYNPALEQRVTVHLRQRLYSAIVSARWPFLVERRASDLVHATTIDMERVSSATYQMLTLVTGIAVTGAYVAIAARMSLLLTLLVGICGAVLLWGLRSGTTRSTSSGEAYSGASRELFARASESIAGLKVAKSLGAEPRDVAIFGKLSGALSASYLGLLRAYAQAKLRSDLASAALVCVLLLVAVEGLHLRGAGLLVLIFIFARIMPRLVSLQESAQVFVSALPSFDTVLRLIEACEAAAERDAPDDGRRIVASTSVALDDVWYAYGRDGAPVLKGVSLCVPVGCVTAIAGASGAGKSTIADLLLGLLQPTRGAVRVDGRPIGSEDAAAWRRSIGYVPQDSFLLHDTVRANLRWARPDASEDDMWEALEIAAAASVVRARPEGLDTVVGDRGVRLSGGERQRLALARALVTRPDLLVLDEATSALDSANEQQILAAVSRLRGRLTVILITHRLSTIRDADLVHVMKEGRVVESGAWGELAARPGGAFSALLALQRLDAADQAPGTVS